MRTIQIFATGSATANAVAQVIIPTASKIRGMQLGNIYDSITDGAGVRLEFSKVATQQTQVNGAQDPFLMVAWWQNFVTSGMATGMLNQYFPLDVSCRQGEIIYVHALVNGTVSYSMTGIIWYG